MFRCPSAGQQDSAGATWPTFVKNWRRPPVASAKDKSIFYLYISSPIVSVVGLHTAGGWAVGLGRGLRSLSALVLMTS